MRGARDLVDPVVYRVRIIPADAGSTFAHYVLAIGHWDHPRGCGEHVPVGVELKPATGSSPRMRGAPVGC